MFLVFLGRKDPHGFFAFPVTDAIAPGYSMIDPRASGFCHRQLTSECRYFLCDDSYSGQLYQMKGMLMWLCSIVRKTLMSAFTCGCGTCWAIFTWHYRRCGYNNMSVIQLTNVGLHTNPPGCCYITLNVCVPTITTVDRFRRPVFRDTEHVKETHSQSTEGFGRWGQTETVRWPHTWATGCWCHSSYPCFCEASVKKRGVTHFFAIATTMHLGLRCK